MNIPLNLNGTTDRTRENYGYKNERMILDTAWGQKSKSELHGYGQNEFVPWYLGAVM